MPIGDSATNELFFDGDFEIIVSLFLPGFLD